MEHLFTVQSASVGLAFLAMVITLIGTWISVKWGTRPDGWSDCFAITLFLTMGGLTIWTFFQFVPIKEDVGGIYTALVFWYLFLFIIGQRLMVVFTKRLMSS